MFDEKIPPMLAYSSEPFDSRRHIFEIKWDGTRCILFIRGKEVRLQNRRLIDITFKYPELSKIYNEVEAKNAILDGELVVVSEGKPDFNKLQQREHISDPLKIKIFSQRMPITYIVFDLLYLNDKKYFQAKLIERKEILKNILKEPFYLMESKYIKERGKAYFKEVVGYGFEGVMAKSINSPYLIGKRSRYWLKIKKKYSEECYIIGYTKGKGAREEVLGSLAIATLTEGKWVYRGKVGSGFDEEILRELSEKLKKLRVDSPTIPILEKVRGVLWVKPELRCEVIYQEMTEKKEFRAPVFKRLL